MLDVNPFAELSALISPSIMQGYIILMVIMVAGGTILDMIHKKSAKYFFENSEKAAKNAKRTVSGGEKVSMAVATVANEVLTSAEFASTRRRISHLLTMYGFIIFVATTAWLIFGYPTAEAKAPAALTAMWHIGAIMLCIGGYWFWFFIRVDVSSEGVKWYNFNGRGDLFIIGLITTPTFALLWSGTLGGGIWNTIFLVLFIAFATMLFSTVFWSKFAHMFFKPAAAFQKRVTRADGSQENLPDVGEMNDPAIQSRYPDIPEYMGDNPPNMGLGIKREAPRHY
jgi:predicted small integral membrane protein